ncbi:MAG: hypothetical protein ACXWPJ_04975, partial [Candidatus Limnocylindrales bacterium]
LALPITAAARDVYRYLFRRAGPPPMAPEAASASLLPHGHGPMVRTAADAARRAGGGVAPASEPDPSAAGPTTAAEPTPAGPATAEVAPSSKPT